MVAALVLVIAILASVVSGDVGGAAIILRASVLIQ